MAIHVCAYAPNSGEEEHRVQEEKLFCRHLSLLLDRENEILATSEYFYCPLSFSWCSFLWLGGSGPLCLGHLLLGWRNGLLIEQCPVCAGTLFIMRVGGSILSGSNSNYGFCRDCDESRAVRQSEFKIFKARMDFALSVRKRFPQEVSHWEEYDGSVFSWGGNGLQPARKKKLVVEKVVEPVSLDVLLQELETGAIRKGNPPEERQREERFQFELRTKNGAIVRFPADTTPGL